MFLVCRRLPYLLLFPLSGLAADRLDRGLLLLACCLVEGAVSFALPLVVLHRRLECVGRVPPRALCALPIRRLQRALPTHEPACALLLPQIWEGRWQECALICLDRTAIGCLRWCASTA